MVEVVSEAISRLRRDEWWESVRASLDDMSPTDAAIYQADLERLDADLGTDLHDD